MFEDPQFRCIVKAQSIHGFTYGTIIEHKQSLCPENPNNYPLFFRLLDQNSENDASQSCCGVTSEHIPVSPREVWQW